MLGLLALVFSKINLYLILCQSLIIEFPEIPLDFYVKITLKLLLNKNFLGDLKHEEISNV
jgi:hypothetical protein